MKTPYFKDESKDARRIDEFDYADGGNINIGLPTAIILSWVIAIFLIWLVCQFCNSIDDVLK